MSDAEPTDGQDPREFSIVERLRAGLLDDASGLTDATRDAIARRLSDLPIVGDEFSAAKLFADAAVRSWLPEVIEAYDGPAALVGELEHGEPIRDEASAHAACERARFVHVRVDSVLEKATAHHAAQSADAMARAFRTGERDAAHTAAHNAGRVLGELVVAGAVDRAEQLLRTAVANAAGDT